MQKNDDDIGRWFNYVTPSTDVPKALQSSMLEGLFLGRNHYLTSYIANWNLNVTLADCSIIHELLLNVYIVNGGVFDVVVVVVVHDWVISELAEYLQYKILYLANNEFLLMI